MSIAVVGGMTLDDLVLSDGTVHRRVPGGNALYAALGAHIWGVASDICSFVGRDYPPKVLDYLQDRGIRTQFIARTGLGSIRLWILYEEDGRRQIHLQHDSATLTSLADIATEALERMLRGPDRPAVAHIAALPVGVQSAIARVLTHAGVPFALDALEAKGSVGGDLLDFLDIAKDIAPQAFLPSREEFALLFGTESSPQFRAWSATTPTSTLVIKDGGHGSILFAPPNGPAMHIPALECLVKDPTGAGDAYCGGYVAGMVMGNDPLKCAVMGTVSASYAVEGVGIRGLLSTSQEDVQCRRDRLGHTIERAKN